MRIIRTLSILIITTVLMSSLAMAEGQKLREKLSKGTILLTADVKGCDEDAKKFCKGLDPKSEKAFMCMMAYEDMLFKQ